MAPHEVTLALASVPLVLGKPHNATLRAVFWSRENRVSQSTQSMSHNAELSPGLMPEEGHVPSLPPPKVLHPLITGGRWLLPQNQARMVCVCVFKSHFVATKCFEISQEEQTLGWVALAMQLNCFLLSLKDGFFAFKSLSCLDIQIGKLGRWTQPHTPCSKGLAPS